MAKIDDGKKVFFPFWAAAAARCDPRDVRGRGLLNLRGPVLITPTNVPRVTPFQNTQPPKVREFQLKPVQGRVPGGVPRRDAALHLQSFLHRFSAAVFADLRLLASGGGGHFERRLLVCVAREGLVSCLVQASLVRTKARRLCVGVRVWQALTTATP